MPERPEGLGISDSLGRRLEADMTRYSLPLLLRLEDRNMMAFGIESRVPFVDHVLVEWIAKLPAELRLSRGWTKWILREAFVGILPDRVRKRKSKLGFLTPWSTWLTGPLSSWLRETLSRPKHLSNIVDVGAVQELLARHIAGDHSSALLAVLLRLAIYEAWAQQFLESRIRSYMGDDS